MTSVGIVMDGPAFEMDSREDLVLSFDMSAWFEAGDTFTAGTPELIRFSDGLAYAAGLFGPIAIAGQIIAQEVKDLEPGERYWLILPFHCDNQTYAPRKQLVCPPP